MLYKYFYNNKKSDRTRNISSFKIASISISCSPKGKIFLYSPRTSKTWFSLVFCSFEWNYRLEWCSCHHLLRNIFFCSHLLWKFRQRVFLLSFLKSENFAVFFLFKSLRLIEKSIKNDKIIVLGYKFCQFIMFFEKSYQFRRRSIISEPLRRNFLSFEKSLEYLFADACPLAVLVHVYIEHWCGWQFFDRTKLSGDRYT